MRWKLLLGLFIIIGIAGLLIFSEQGRNFRERYLNKYIEVIGSYLRGITGKFVKQKIINRTLDMVLDTGFSVLYGQEFRINGNALELKLSYESISIDDRSVSLKAGEKVEFRSDKIFGDFIIDKEGKVRVYGEAPSLEINKLTFTPQAKDGKIKFFISGSPLSFSLPDIEKESMTLSKVSGTLKFKDWSPLALKEDEFFISNFKGSVELSEGSLVISGKADKARLNGIDLRV